jgi:hypothetical protein
VRGGDRAGICQVVGDGDSELAAEAETPAAVARSRAEVTVHGAEEPMPVMREGTPHHPEPPRQLSLRSCREAPGTTWAGQSNKNKHADGRDHGPGRVHRSSTRIHCSSPSEVSPLKPKPARVFIRLDASF